MNRMNFSANWNRKLDSLVFTTVRKVGLTNYVQKEGEDFEIFLKRKLYTKAKLFRVNRLKFSHVLEEFLMLDTGYLEPYALFKKFGVRPDDDVWILVFYQEGREIQ